MPRLLLILLAALGGAAIWRRKEIRDDADRASKALAGAAGTAKSRVRPGDADVDDHGDDAVEQSAAEAEDPADSAASTG